MNPAEGPGPETLGTDPYLVAQLTVPTGTDWDMIVGRVQGRPIDRSAEDWDAMNVAWTNRQPSPPPPPTRPPPPPPDLCAETSCPESPCKIAGECDPASG